MSLNATLNTNLGYIRMC